MRVALQPIDGEVQVTFDPLMDRKLFIELLLPAHRGGVLGEKEDPFPHMISDVAPQPPKAAKLKVAEGWKVVYDCTNIINGEFKVKFPTWTLWSRIQFDTLKVTVKGPLGSVAVLKIPPPEAY